MLGSTIVSSTGKYAIAVTEVVTSERVKVCEEEKVNCVEEVIIE